MPDPPLVSVIIPTYNRASLLLAAIESVASQTYPHWEIVVADDGSTDDTAARLAQRPEPIRHLRLEHAGRPGAARNRALAEARGPVVAFLDDDDLWQPDKLALQTAALAARPDLGMVYSAVRFLTPDGNLSGPVLSPRAPRGGDLFGPLLAECFVYISTVLVRRDRLEACGGFDETMSAAEDYDLWLRLAPHVSACALPEPLACIRHHPGGISATRELDVWRNTLSILHRTRDAGALSFRHRLRLRRSLARAHTRVATLQGHDPAARWDHLRRALTLNPLQRRGWAEVAATAAGRRREAPPDPGGPALP